jgi:sugar phosphate isomerase/epimerase
MTVGRLDTLKEKWDETISLYREMSEAFHAEGIQLLYHNHDFEFVKVDGEYALDMLYRVIPAEHLMTEIDTCWVNVGGENPAEYVKKYTGRAPIVHLKDFYMEKGATQDDMYELIGVEKKANQTSAFEFRPVGHGVQKFPAIVDAAAEAGAGWLVVEQDRPSLGLTSMESIDISRKYLRSIGL